MSTPGALVDELRKRVAERIGANRYRTWFSETADFAIRRDDEAVDVIVGSPFVGRWIASNFMDDLVAAAGDVLGTARGVDVRIVERPNGTPRGADAPAEIAPRKRVSRRARGGSSLRGRLDDFVVGESNVIAYNAICGVANAPGDAFPLLVVHSPCGLGKTHLLHGLCRAVQQNHPTAAWRYVAGEEFTNEFIYALKSGRLDVFRDRFRSVDLLVIDDIHFLADKSSTQDEFLHTFNAINGVGKTIVLSSDRHPREIATLSEPLINRLISGIVVQIDPPDYATRREILRRLAAKRAYRIQDEVIDFIAHKVTRNVRELEGALYTLVALGGLTGQPLTVALAQQALSEHLAYCARRPGVAEIEAAVAAYFDVTTDQIRSKSRDRSVSLARAVAAYLIRKHTPLSFPEIGRAIGGKNHSTILMAVQRVERLTGEDASVAWKNGDGRRVAPIRQVLTDLERTLFPGNR
ncbi:MAG: chromosomal replication initiator protein DnaA [Planctomycetota bacterium]|nr:MAG: chromosomal replication initiator protein DnaA [Planctomycetota bacterium]